MLTTRINWLMSSARESIRSFISIIILVIFTLIGGVIFMSIEGPNEKYELEKLKKERSQLLEDTAFRLNTIKHMTPIEAYNHTIDTLVHFRNELGVNEVHLNDTKWNIWGSIYYSLTIYTTIGYGNIAPHTTTGRVLTILYAFIGIPLALISLIALGSLFAKGCLVIWKFLLRACGCFSKNLEQRISRLGPEYNREGSEDSGSENDPDELLHFPVTFLIFLTVCWIFLCAYIFQFLEETWSYGTSLYFVLISFTTIGFGDVLVSKSKYIIVVGCLLLIGLALVSTVLNIIQKQIAAVAANMKDSIDKDYMLALDEANEDMDLEDARNAGIGSKGDDGDGRDGSKHSKLDNVVKKMPMKNRFLYQMMPESNKKQLAKHAKKRAQTKVQWVQTDPWLMDNAGFGVENVNY